MVYFISMRKFLVFIGLLYFISGQLKSQSFVDSSDFITFFDINAGYYIPAADMSERFGLNASVGGAFNIKNKKNWTFGCSYNYIFGDDVKNERTYLSSILVEDGFIIDGNGQYAEINLMERGWNVFLSAGKIIPVVKRNRNSGIWINTGFGLLEHRILINNPLNLAPQIKGDYKKGYDKLSNGFALNQFVGFIWMNKKSIFNTYAGLNVTAAWTENRRSYDFVIAQKPNEKRFDMIIGIKVGWVIPVYRRTPDPFYYR